MIKALAYLRTSSATNVEGDSSERQRIAIQRFAAANGYEIVQTFYDAAVSGADPVETRKGFADMLDRIDGNGVRTILIEDASRFARDLMTQELGIVLVAKRGVTVLNSSGDNLTNSDDPSRKVIRQMFGMFAEYEKAMLVLKLKGARDRLSSALGRRIEGRKGHRAEQPDMIYGAVSEIIRQFPHATLSGIAQELVEAGLTTSNGKPYGMTQVVRVIKALGLPKVDGRSK